MSAIYSCTYGRVFKLFCCFSCPSTSPAQEIILALTHHKAFHHQANRCGEYWSHPDTELEKLLAKSFTVGGNSEKWGSLSLEGSKTCSTAKANLSWCWMLATRFPVPFCWHFWDCQRPLSA